MVPTVPPGFTAETIAHVQQARELAVAPNGDLFVGTSSNRIYVIHHPGSGAQAPRIFVTLPDDQATALTFAPKSLIVGTQFGVWRIPYHDGDLRAHGAPRKIASVRNSGISRDHLSTSVAYTHGHVFASVGSPCNACNPNIDPTPTRATIQEMTLGGGGMHARAVHWRNAIALAANPATGTLWAAGAEQDELQVGHPYEPMDAVTVHPGTPNYGWPKCYENHRVAERGANCRTMTVTRVVFPAYETPIGMAFYPLHPVGRHPFPRRYRGGAFVTWHGSWHTPLRPPEVVFVPIQGDNPSRPVDWRDPTKQWRAFATGFQVGQERLGRATGVAVGREGDLFVADDAANAVYRIRANASRPSPTGLRRVRLMRSR